MISGRLVGQLQRRSSKKLSRAERAAGRKSGLRVWNELRPWPVGGDRIERVAPVVIPGRRVVLRVARGPLQSRKDFSTADRAVLLEQKAARAAADRGAPESAATYLRRALHEQPHAAWRPAALFQLGMLEAAFDGGTAVAHLEEAYRAHALFVAHDDDPEFGYRFLVDEARQAGEPMAARTAWRICSENGWWSAFGKPKARGHGKKPGPPVHDDLCAVVDEHGVVRHRFNATAPNDLWLTDITEHGTSEGKLYLCAVKDAYSNRIVGYSISDRMKSRLAVDALASAVARRRVEGADVAGCIVHSDRGSQFRSRKFVHALKRNDLVGSMGRVGAAGDNAAMESFFALLQKNVLNRRSWTTREELRIAIVTWIEKTYHRRRRQDALGRLTPIEYETIMTTHDTTTAPQAA